MLGKNKEEIFWAEKTVWQKLQVTVDSPGEQLLFYVVWDGHECNVRI